MTVDSASRRCTASTSPCIRTPSSSTIPAKGGAQRRQVIADPASFQLIASLRRRRAGGDQLLAYREGRRWHPIRSDDINDYLKQHLGEDFSAKDFRTWNGTAMAAVSLGTHGLDASTKTARALAAPRGSTCP